MDITTVRIINAVCEYYGVTVDELQSPSRKQRLVTPRHVAMALVRMRTDKTLEDTGLLFNRDHTSVCHAMKSVSETIPSDLCATIDNMEDKPSKDLQNDLDEALESLKEIRSLCDRIINSVAQISPKHVT